MSKDRATICLIETALQDGYTITVSDGAKTLLSKSKDFDAILGVVFTKEVMVLHLHKFDRFAGFITLDFTGDVEDLFSDNTPTLDGVVQDTMDVIEG